MKRVNLISTMVLAATLTACGSPEPRPVSDISTSGVGAYRGVQYGTVSSIEQIESQGRTSGLGAAIGGVAGGLAGRQIGSGTGRDVATVAGAVGGAVIGNQVEKRRAGPETAYRVTIRSDGGGYQSYEQATIGDLRVGDRVIVEDGQVFRRY